MLFIYCTEVSLIFSIVPECIDAFVPCSHQFKNYTVVEIGVLYSQLFMDSHFQFFITRYQPTYQVLLKQPRWMICCLLCKLQVLPPTEKYNTWLTQNLQARKPYLLNIPYIKETKTRRMSRTLSFKVFALYHFQNSVFLNAVQMLCTATRYFVVNCGECQFFKCSALLYFNLIWLLIWQNIFFPKLQQHHCWSKME
jgi:hypothetical protein